ncbi:MAG: type II toxin-antitoxin system VapC family toxin [Terriglobales bacterium]
MKLLLDTHIWIWSVSEWHRLARQVQQQLLDPECEKWLSPISTWELILLTEKQRFSSPLSPAAWIERARSYVNWHEAPLTAEVALEAATVKLSYRDPSDRLLLATARWYGLKLVTADERLLAHGGAAVLPNR